jgi:hypothetical protein
VAPKASLCRPNWIRSLARAEGGGALLWAV